MYCSLCEKETNKFVRDGNDPFKGIWTTEDHHCCANVEKLGQKEKEIECAKPFFFFFKSSLKDLKKETSHTYTKRKKNCVCLICLSVVSPPKKKGLPFRTRE